VLNWDTGALGHVETTAPSTHNEAVPARPSHLVLLSYDWADEVCSCRLSVHPNALEQIANAKYGSLSWNELTSKSAGRDPLLFKVPRLLCLNRVVLRVFESPLHDPDIRDSPNASFRITVNIAGVETQAQSKFFGKLIYQIRGPKASQDVVHTFRIRATINQESAEQHAQHSPASAPCSTQVAIVSSGMGLEPGSLCLPTFSGHNFAIYPDDGAHSQWRVHKSVWVKSGHGLQLWLSSKENTTFGLLRPVALDPYNGAVVWSGGHYLQVQCFD